MSWCRASLVLRPQAIQRLQSVSFGGLFTGPWPAMSGQEWTLKWSQIGLKCRMPDDVEESARISFESWLVECRGVHPGRPLTAAKVRPTKRSKPHSSSQATDVNATLRNRERLWPPCTVPHVRLRLDPARWSKPARTPRSLKGFEAPGSNPKHGMPHAISLGSPGRATGRDHITAKTSGGS